MAQVNMGLVKELRERTQAGLGDCKSALEEAGGDVEKAVEVILKRGLAKSAKRAGALAAEGEIATCIAGDGRSAVIVEVNIQTDFAARNADFRAFVQKVIAAASQAQEGAALLLEGAAGTQGSLEAERQQLVARLGENIQLRRWTRLNVEGPGFVHSYLHLGGKIGALVGVSLADAGAREHPEVRKFADDMAMQVAAMNPLYLRRSDVPETVKGKQREIFDEQLREEGKPEQARPKIAEGKLDKWFKECCLLEQVSVINSERTVEQDCAAVGKEAGAGIKLTGFVRYQVAEGIEIPKGDDFAVEAERMAGLV